MTTLRTMMSIYPFSPIAGMANGEPYICPSVSREVIILASSTHVVGDSVALVDDHQQPIVTVPLLEKRRDVPLSTTREDFLLVESVGEDERPAGIEPRLEEMSDRFP